MFSKQISLHVTKPAIIEIAEGSILSCDFSLKKISTKRLHVKIMEDKIEAWESLRDRADQIIKNQITKHFPCQYGYPAPDKTESSRQYEMEMGRALWAYARSDLVIKGIQIKDLL